VIYGLSHVDVSVRDLKRALPLYRDGLGFPVVREGEGWVEVNASTAAIRLIETPSVERRAALRIEAASVEEGTSQLVKYGASVVYPLARTALMTLEVVLHDQDGNIITLWRALSEDEYGFDPELPVEGRWDAEAEALLKSLLRSVPALFRALARRKVVKEAETRAGPGGRVGRDLVIRSFISAQSPPNRRRLVEPLRAHGIDPSAYQDEFES
jgi:catechol 2,3-dioxygenase-like lactoylglutathione lyase family enzyme